MSTIQLQATLPSAPSATRAIPLRADSSNGRLAYGSGSSVVIVDLNSKTSPVLVCVTFHKSPVTALRFSPSGKLIASGDEDGSLVVWKAEASATAVFKSKALQGAVRDIAWVQEDATDKVVMVVGEGRTNFGSFVSVTGNPLGAVDGHARTVMTCDACATSSSQPVAESAVSGSADGLLAFYRGQPLQFLRTVEGHEGTLTTARWSPDGRWIASTSSSRDLILVDAAEPSKVVRVPTGHAGTIYAVAWSPSGRQVCTASADKSIALIDVASKSVTRSVKLGTALPDMQQGVAFLDQSRVATLSLGGVVTVIDTARGTVVQRLYGHRSRILACCIAASAAAASRIVSVSVDGTVVDASPAVAGETTHATLPPDVVVNAVASTDKALFLSCPRRLFAYTFEKKSFVPLEFAGGTAPSMTCIAAAEGSPFLVGVDRLQVYVCIVDTTSATVKVVATAASPTFAVKCIAHCATSHEESLVALGGDGGACQLFRVHNSSGSATFSAGSVLPTQRSESLCSLAFNPSKQAIIAGNTVGSVMQWSWTTEAALGCSPCYHTQGVACIAVSGGGSTVVSGSGDGSVIAWDGVSLKRQATEHYAHNGGVSSLALVTVGAKNMLATTGADFLVKLWAL